MALGLLALSLYLGYRWRASSDVEWAPPSGRVHRGTLTARLVGRKGSPVLLLHGFLGSGKYWGAAFDQLGRDHLVIVPDLLGFGDSPKPASGYGVEEHTAALEALLSELGVREPVVVVGHSLGGVLALRFAARYPHRVRGVLAFGPPLYGDPAVAREKLAAFDPMAGMLTLDSPLARRSCVWFHGHPKASAAVVRLLRPDLPPLVARDASRHTWASYWGTLSGLVLASGGPGWLAEVRGPVRLVFGEQDPAADWSFVRPLAHVNPGFSLRVVHGGGHNLPLTHPALCRGEIARLAGARGRPPSGQHRRSRWRRRCRRRPWRPRASPGPSRERR